MAMLEDCYRLGLLRTVGPVYQFRHSQLQDHLAPPPPNPRPPIPERAHIERLDFGEAVSIPGGGGSAGGVADGVEQGEGASGNSFHAVVLRGTIV